MQVVLVSLLAGLLHALVPGTIVASSLGPSPPFVICEDQKYALCASASCFVYNDVAYCKCNMLKGDSISLSLEFSTGGESEDVCDVNEQGKKGGYMVSTFSLPSEILKGGPAAIYTCPGVNNAGDGVVAPVAYGQCDGGLCFTSTKGKTFHQSGSFCSQGNVQYWREEVTGSIGLLVDLQGDDQYSGAGKDNHLWKQAYYGGCIDTSAMPLATDLKAWVEVKPIPPMQQMTEPVNPLLVEHREPLPELEGDLDYEHQRLDAVEKLSAMGAGIIPRLMEYLIIRDIQLTGTVREILLKIGKRRCPCLTGRA